MKSPHFLNLKIYWCDYLISTSIFFICFYYFYTELSTLAFIIGSIFLYRAAAFTHELAHQRNNRNIRKFKRFWNMTMGFIILQPSCRFAVPHLRHHKTGVFATHRDPQYPLIRKNIKLAAAIFFILPVVIPLYNLLICFMPRNKKLENILYQGSKFTEGERLEIEQYELYYLVAFSIIALSMPSVLIPWYLISIGAWFLSVLRIPLEHPLDYYRETSTSNDQMTLSNTYECPIFILVQPLSLRYHKAHHMYPKIPYHNLPDYHYRLKIKGCYKDKPKELP